MARQVPTHQLSSPLPGVRVSSRRQRSQSRDASRTAPGRAIGGGGVGVKHCFQLRDLGPHASPRGAAFLCVAGSWRPPRRQ